MAKIWLIWHNIHRWRKHWKHASEETPGIFYLLLILKWNVLNSTSQHCVSMYCTFLPLNIMKTFIIRQALLCNVWMLWLWTLLNRAEFQCNLFLVRSSEMLFITFENYWNKRITVKLITTSIYWRWALWLNVRQDQTEELCLRVCVFKTCRVWRALVAAMWQTKVIP